MAKDQTKGGIPALETARLILRAHKLEDFDSSFAMWSDPLTTRFIGGQPSTREAAQSRVINYLVHWKLMSFGYWAILEKGSNSFVGELGFADFRRDTQPPILGIPEVGWVLTPAMQGKGYATEAAQAAHEWADEFLGVPKTVCLIDPAHAASIRLAEKFGYKEYARSTFKGLPMTMFERLTPRHG